MATLSACTEDTEPNTFTPALENECYSSCFDTTVFDTTCLNNPLVIDYTMNRLLRPQWEEIKQIMSRNPVGSCYCAVAKINAAGELTKVTTMHSTGINMGNAIQKSLSEFESVPIPSGAECIVDANFPIGFDNSDG